MSKQQRLDSGAQKMIVKGVDIIHTKFRAETGLSFAHYGYDYGRIEAENPAVAREFDPELIRSIAWHIAFAILTVGVQ